jgi:hypothetical protein
MACAPGIVGGVNDTRCFFGCWDSRGVVSGDSLSLQFSEHVPDDPGNLQWIGSG